MDKFVLKRKYPNDYKQTGNSRPKISVYPSTYYKLVEWNSETGLSFARLVDLAVAYADKHLEDATNGTETDSGGEHQ